MNHSRFVLLLLLLGAFVRAACADSAPQERLYFLRADRSAFAITFQGGHPRAIRRLYSGWESEKLTAEINSTATAVGAAGHPTTRLATYLADQVHTLGDAMVIETDYRMYDALRLVAHPLLAKDQTGHHPDGARLRRLLYLRPGTNGAWDCVTKVDIDSEEKAQEGEAAKQIALWRTTPPGRTPLSTDDLLPIPTDDLIPILMTAESDPAAIVAPLDQLRARFPQDPFLATLDLDLAMVLNDEARLTARLAAVRPILTAAGGTFYAPSIHYYELWLEGLKATRDGRNAYAKLGGTVPALDNGLSLKDQDAVALKIRTVKAGDLFFSGLQPLLLRWSIGAPNFLDTQTYFKTTRVRAEFELFRGDPSAALDILVPNQRLASVMNGESPEFISNLIGVACSAITTAGLVNVYLCGFESADDTRANWPVLDELYKFHLRESEKPLSLRIASGDGFPAPNYRPANNWEELNARNKTALSRIALLHTVTALRYQVLKDGYLPPGWGNLELLPDGPDPDPFGKRRERLRILPWRKDVDLVAYSLGPDGEDNRAAVDYDPTNGTISSGDLVLKASDPPHYPFPRRGELGRTRDEILAQFPNGLPPDPFADTKGSGYAVTDQVPAAIISWGPDVDQARIPGKKLPADATAPAGMAISTMPDGSRLGYPALIPELPYDPTNGTISEGDLVYRRK